MDDKEEIDEPIIVQLKKEEKKINPDFDYDDYSPSDVEILETEKEIEEIVKKRTTDGS